jgi:carboxyl-terminal processing protease
MARSFHMHAKQRRQTNLVAASLAALILSACGGGGGGGAAPPPPPPPPPPITSIAPSTNFAGVRLNPNAQPGQPGSGTQAADWDAASCTDPRQKNWVRSKLNEDYLFYKDAPLTTLDPNTFAGTPQALFGAYTRDALPQQDRFSFVITQAEADAVFLTGTATDLGLELRREAGSNLIRIAYIEPDSAAGKAGIKRGGVLATVNGQPSSNGLTEAQINALFSSAPGAVVNVGIQAAVGGAVTDYALTSTTYSSVPVLVNKVLPGTTVGYLAYNSFSTPIGEIQLADAFKGFAQAGVTDLVVDLRYNGGGFVFISSQLAYMVAGQAQTENKAYIRYVHNDKRTAENRNLPFLNVLTDNAVPARANEPLTTLNLKRVFVLTSGNTCSASEDFANALTGVGVQVVYIGSTTCGKPYIFSDKNNCALSYFPIEIEGRNNANAPVPVTGLTPVCPAADDFTKDLGDPTEKMLATALIYRATGSCPAAAASAFAGARKVSGSNEDLEFVPLHKRIALDRTLK